MPIHTCTRPVLAAAVGLGLLAPAGCATEDSQQASGTVRTSDLSRSTQAPSATRPATTTTPVSGGSTTTVGGVAIEHAKWTELGYRWDWAGSPFLSTGGVIEFVDVYHDKIVVQESGSVISVLDPRSGALVWSADLPGRASKLVGNVRVDDTVFSTTETDLFEIDLGTGNLIDREALPHVVNTPPVILGNLAVFGTGSGQALAFNRSFGVEVWAYQLNGPINAAPIAIDDTVVAFVSQSGDVIFLNTRTGRSVGRARISGGLANDPVTDGYRLFIASEDQSVYAFDAEGGQRMWRHRTSHPLRTQPVLHEDVLYYSSGPEGVTALNATTGEVKWNLPDLGNAWVVGVRDGYLLLWDGRFATTVDPEFGEIVRRVELPGVRGLRTDKFVDGNLYAVAGGGKLLRFTSR